MSFRSDSCVAKVLVQNSDDDEDDVVNETCDVATRSDRNTASCLQSPNPRRPAVSSQSHASSIFSPRAAACAELLLAEQAEAKTPHDRLALLKRVGHLGGPYGECLKGSPAHSMWLRYVEFNQSVIDETERFLAARRHERGGSLTAVVQRSRPRTASRDTAAVALNSTHFSLVGSRQPLPAPPPRLSRSLSSVRSATPGATNDHEEVAASLLNHGAYELSQGERCALSLFALDSDTDSDGQHHPCLGLGHKRFARPGEASDMAPSQIYEGCTFTTAIQSIDRVKRARIAPAPLSIESPFDDMCDNTTPSLSGTVIETQIAKSQREWLDWSRSATLCRY